MNLNPLTLFPSKTYMNNLKTTWLGGDLSERVRDKYKGGMNRYFWLQKKRKSLLQNLHSMPLCSNLCILHCLAQKLSTRWKKNI